MVTQIGESLDLGAGTITGSYIVESRDEADKDIDSEDIFDEDGARNTRIIYNSDDKISLNLICVNGALPQTDFVKGEIAAHVDFNDKYVEESTFTRSKSARRGTVTLVNIGIT